MFRSEELIQWILQFGRWNVQEFVAKSRDMKDVLNYLRAEWVLEMVMVMPFVTLDLVRFEKITGVPPVDREGLRDVPKMA